MIPIVTGEVLSYTGSGIAMIELGADISIITEFAIWLRIHFADPCLRNANARSTHISPWTSTDHDRIRIVLTGIGRADGSIHVAEKRSITEVGVRGTIDIRLASTEVPARNTGPVVTEISHRALVSIVTDAGIRGVGTPRVHIAIIVRTEIAIIAKNRKIAETLRCGTDIASGAGISVIADRAIQLHRLTTQTRIAVGHRAVVPIFAINGSA